MFIYFSYAKIHIITIMSKYFGKIFSKSTYFLTYVKTNNVNDCILSN